MRAVVLGGSVDGLAAALLLARAGASVTLLAPEASLGGLAARAELGEGYSVPGSWHETARVLPWALAALALDPPRRPRAPFVAAGGATSLLLHGDPARDATELAAHAPADAEGYVRLWAMVDRVRPLLHRMMAEAPPEVAAGAPLWPLAKVALDVRRLGATQMMELLRIGPLPMADWLAEHVQSPALAAALAAPALVAGRMGPRSPQGVGHFLLEAGLRGDQEIDGGPAALADQLVAACAGAGVALHVGAAVERIRVERGAVTGVESASGAVDADLVLSAMGPRKTLFDLLDPAATPGWVEAAARKIRARGSVAVLRLGVQGEVALAGRPDADRARVGGDLDELERAWDGVKHRRLAERLPADVWVPSKHSPSCAPGGGAAVSVLTHFAPHDLAGGWTPDAADALEARMLAAVERVVPGISERVVVRELLTPADLERQHALEGGHPEQAERALDQLWVTRPAPGLARFATGVNGLFLCGAGSHPGGVLTCGPGVLGAQAALRR